MFTQYIKTQDSDQIVRSIERALDNDLTQVPSLIAQLKQSQIQPRTLLELCKRVLTILTKYRGIVDSSEAELREISSECLQALGLFAEAADQLAQADAFNSSTQRLLQIADLYL